MCCTFLLLLLQLCAFLPASACIVFPLGENFSTIANIVLKAAITVPLRSLAPAKPSQAAAPKALDICIRSARTGRTLSPAAAVAVT